MITVAMLNIVMVYLAFFARYRRWEFLLKVSFLLLFIFLALRYDFGNDYMAYLKDFLKLDPFSTIDFFNDKSKYEPGWTFLCHLFRPFDTMGFFAMTAVLALLNCFVYYRFIKKYVPPNYYWLAVFLYLFNPGLMLIHSSAMRQSVAISLFLLSIDSLYKKNAVGYFLCIALAISFHASAVILLPVYLIVLCNWNINKIAALFLLSAYIMFIFFGKILKPELNAFIAGHFTKYTIYKAQSGVEIGTGLGLLFYSLLFVLILLYEQYQTKENAIVFKIAIISYLLMPISLIVMILGRCAMYFQPATIVVMPILFANMKSRLISYSIMILLLIITIMSFNGFFQSKIWEKRFGTYHTIFSSSEI
jgi:transmembrane protein EpsG